MLRLCTLVLLASSVALAGEAGGVSVAKMGKVFVSDEGVEVAVVPRADPKSKEALVQFTGTEREHEGRVFLAERRDWGENTDYQIRVDRRPFVIFSVRGTKYSGAPPGYPRELRFRYDDSKSQALVTDQVLKVYLSQGER